MGYDLYIHGPMTEDDRVLSAELNLDSEPGYFRSNISNMAWLAEHMDSAGMLSHPKMPTQPDGHIKVNKTEKGGIPAYKLESNDGWHVRSSEIRTALKQGKAATFRFTSAQQESYWNKWLKFLEIAMRSDGFQVW